MGAGLETFAKVRALNDRSTVPGEKAAARALMVEAQEQLRPEPKRDIGARGFRG